MNKKRKKKIRIKILKRIIGGSAIVLSLILFLIPSFAKAAAPDSANVVASGKCGDDATWTFYDNGLLLIGGKGQMWDFSDYGSYRGWEDYIDQITSISVEENVSMVGNYAFQNHNRVKSITVDGACTTIGTYAFYGCGDIDNVFLSENIGWIHAYSFSDTNINEVRFGGEKEVWDQLKNTSEEPGNSPLFNAGRTYFGQDSSTESYTVSFYAGGILLKEEVVEKGGAATPPTDEEISQAFASIPEYRFGGWENESYLDVNSELQINAVLIRTYSVYFNVDGEVIFQTKVDEGAAVPDFPEDPYKEGYAFTGWDPSDLSNISADTKVSAVFTENETPETHLVRFYLDGEMINEQVVNYGEAATEPEVEVPSGYRFSGWDHSDFSSVTEDMDIYGTLVKSGSSGGEGEDDPDDPDEPLKPYDGTIDNIDERADKGDSSAFTATVIPTPEVDVSLWIRDSEGRFFKDRKGSKKYADEQYYAVSLVDSNKNIYTKHQRFVLTIPIPKRMDLSKGNAILAAKRADGMLVYPDYEIVEINGFQCFKITAAPDSEYAILYEELAGSNENTETKEVKKDETNTENTAVNTVTQDTNSNTANTQTQVADNANNTSAPVANTNTVTNTQAQTNTVSNVNDMPKTGEKEILRLLFAFVLFIFGLLQIVSSISVKKKIRHNG